MGTTFLALIDGIPFVGPDEEVLLQQVPYGAITRTEIVRGPASALYGRGATAGAVNYITQEIGEDRTTASLSAGTYGYLRGEAIWSARPSGPMAVFFYPHSTRTMRDGAITLTARS